MNPRPVPPRFLTVQEIAKNLRVSKMTVYRLVETGELDHVRIGRSIRIPVVGLQRYLEEAKEYNRPISDLQHNNLRVV